jgi:hypothetical protein
VSVQFGPENGVPWWLTVVYGLQGNDNKIAFLQELQSVRGQCAGPWLVGGDFNLIYKDEDKNNTNLDRPMMGRFRRFIDDVAVKEIPLHGRNFSWTSSSSGVSPTLVKLDRLFYSVDWDQQFPNCLLNSASSEDSDHCLLILGLKDSHQGKRRFHFESFWPKFDGFHEVVQQAWSSILAKPCPMETLSLKFKATAKGLQSWSDKRVGHFKSQLKMAREIVHQLEIGADTRQLTPLEVWLCQGLKKQSLALSSLLRTVARLRSWITWLREGDDNTSLFHSQSRYRKKKNFIAKLINEGQTMMSHGDKVELLLDFYSNLIVSREERHNTIDLEDLGIQHHDLYMMDVPISEEEVWNTIKLLPSNKASDPDGFTGHFYKACWPIIKGDIMAAISALWRRYFRNFRLLNKTYITLIPKSEGANQAKDFRPISLIHSFAKLIKKSLSIGWLFG